MISLDPFLHDWDERFHAVVAKNMIQFPFRPTLRQAAILPYDLSDWCCNYIWLHKQPLFLWQMALSLKFFGISTLALRLPDVLMGVFIIYCSYRIALIWTQNLNIAFFASLFYALAYYNLNLSSGILSLDHNDLMMGGFVTASMWAFSEYTSSPSWKWIFLVGLFSGCAVLVKWLTGMLIFGGWVIFLLTDNEYRFDFSKWKHLAISVLIAFIVFIPWQIYILSTFPAESEVAYAYNVKHLFEDLGHPGSKWFHLNHLNTAYSSWIFVSIMMVGFIYSWKNTTNVRLSISFTGLFVLVYTFFSWIVATKMPGLTFPVAVIGFIWGAIGFHLLWEYIKNKMIGISMYTERISLLSCLIFVCILVLQPHKIVAERNPQNKERQVQIHNTEIYKKLHEQVSPNEIIFNCIIFEDTEVNFWQPNNAYHAYPDSVTIDRLLIAGYKLSVFTEFQHKKLPDYLLKNHKVKKLNFQLE